MLKSFCLFIVVSMFTLSSAFAGNDVTLKEFFSHKKELFDMMTFHEQVSSPYYKVFTASPNIVEILEMETTDLSEASIRSIAYDLMLSIGASYEEASAIETEILRY